METEIDALSSKDNRSEKPGDDLKAHLEGQLEGMKKPNAVLEERVKKLTEEKDEAERERDRAEAELKRCDDVAAERKKRLEAAEKGGRKAMAAALKARR